MDLDGFNDNYLNSFHDIKSNIYERDWNNFDQENFIFDCVAVD